MQVLEFYRSGSHLGLPVYLEEDKSDPEQIKIMKRKTFEIIRQCWALEESEMVLPERIVKDINNGVGNYGECFVSIFLYTLNCRHFWQVKLKYCPESYVPRH